MNYFAMYHKLFVDLDGVLADFDQHHENLFGRRPDGHDADWEKITKHGFFYATMPLMKDARELWDYLKRYEPIILTGVPSSDGDRCADQKRAWGLVHLGAANMITCASKDKATFCVPGDILIDDRIKYKHLWEGAGGIWITHTSASDTIKQLKEMGL